MSIELLPRPETGSSLGESLDDLQTNPKFIEYIKSKNPNNPLPGFPEMVLADNSEPIITEVPINDDDHSSVVGTPLPISENVIHRSSTIKEKVIHANQEHPTGSAKKGRVARRIKNAFGVLRQKRTNAQALSFSQKLKNAQAIERLPDSYVGNEYFSNPNLERYEENGPLRGILENLREEMAFGPKHNSGLLEHSYRIVRNVADVELSLRSGSPQVIKLLDGARGYSRPKMYEGFHHDVAKNLSSKTLASHNEVIKRISVASDLLKLESSQLSAFMKAKGVEIIHPGDESLIALLNTVGHEAGHNVMAGISEILRGRIDSNEIASRLTATSFYVQNNPEIALTGNLDTDVASHEERFSEGYATLVTNKVMESLGYDEKARATIFSYFWDKTSVAASPSGDHPIDFIDQLGARNSLWNIGVQNDKDFNMGDLGYSIPLSPDEINAELQFFENIISSDSSKIDHVDMRANPEKWKVLVVDRQNAGTKARLRTQKLLRTHASMLYGNQPITRDVKDRSVRSIEMIYAQMYQEMKLVAPVNATKKFRK